MTVTVTVIVMTEGESVVVDRAGGELRVLVEKLLGGKKLVVRPVKGVVLLLVSVEVRVVVV